jgi:hypothetical protein
MDDCVTNCCEFVKVSADLVIDCWRYAQEVAHAILTVETLVLPDRHPNACDILCLSRRREPIEPPHDEIAGRRFESTPRRDRTGAVRTGQGADRN